MQIVRERTLTAMMILLEAEAQLGFGECPKRDKMCPKCLKRDG